MEYLSGMWSVSMVKNFFICPIHIIFFCHCVDLFFAINPSYYASLVGIHQCANEVEVTEKNQMYDPFYHLLNYLLICHSVSINVCLYFSSSHHSLEFIRSKNLTIFFFYLCHFSMSFTMMILLWLKIHRDWGLRLGEWGRRMTLCLVQLFITLFTV